MMQFAQRNAVAQPPHAGPAQARVAAPSTRQALGNQAVQTLLRAPSGVVQRQADVRRAPGGLPCILTEEPGPAPELNLLFALGSAALSPANQASIATYAANVGASEHVRVDGYASVDGPQGLNWRLSCDRATAVTNELIGQGVPKARIATLAHGESNQAQPPSLAANRRATVARMTVPALPTLRGAALSQTPGAQAGPLPADTVKTWAALVAAGDREGALRAVVWAMEQHGEINRRLMVTVALPGSTRPICVQDEPFALAPVSGAFTESCGCIGPAGSRTPNPRVRLHPDMVSHVSIGAGQARQTRAEVLHSTLLHEYRHVVQEYEKCNLTGAGTGSGPCTDCNDPSEMDAYLAAIEAGYDSTAMRHAWVRVFVNWGFLSSRQQGVFQARRDAAQTKIDARFPGVNWAADSQVAVYMAFCRRMAATAGPGFCDSPLAPR